MTSSRLPPSFRQEYYLGWKFCEVEPLPLKRAIAERMVRVLPERARQINADIRYRHRICRLAVFGSFLTDKAVLGDLDIGVEMQPKARGWSEDDRIRFERDFPPPAYIKNDFVSRLFWPEAKLRRDLSTGRLTRLHDFAELEVLGCPYRVIFDSMKI